MNILIIGPSWVGDMMMSHSLYQQLKKTYPECHIDVIAPNWCRALLSRMPEVRSAIEMPIGHGQFSLMQRYHLGKELRGQYDLAIVLPNSFKSVLIPLFAKIPQRRGWRGEMRYGVLNDLRSNIADYPMMVQRYVALGYASDDVPSVETITFEYPYLSVDSATVQKTLSHFEKQTALAENRPAIGFCPGAEFGPAKRWPHYHYATLAEQLIKQGYQVQIFGSAKDKAVGDSIQQPLPSELKRYCINLAGQTDLPQVIDLLSQCHAVVSNDSGLMHIAAALDKPLVALYGPTSPTYTPPLARKVKVLRLIEGGLIKVRTSKDSIDGYHQSLIDLEPAKVLDALQALLQ